MRIRRRSLSSLTGTPVAADCSDCSVHERATCHSAASAVSTSAVA